VLVFLRAILHSFSVLVFLFSEILGGLSVLVFVSVILLGSSMLVAFFAEFSGFFFGAPGLHAIIVNGENAFACRSGKEPSQRAASFFLLEFSA